VYGPTMELFKGRAADHQSARGQRPRGSEGKQRMRRRNHDAFASGARLADTYPPSPIFCVGVSPDNRRPIVILKGARLTNPPSPMRMPSGQKGGLPSVRRRRSRFAATTRLPHNRVSTASPTATDGKPSGPCLSLENTQYQVGDKGASSLDRIRAAEVRSLHRLGGQQRGRNWS
jgi:hypothetical protein